VLSKALASVRKAKNRGQKDGRAERWEGKKMGGQKDGRAKRWEGKKMGG
jgi:hypothetical protein